MTGPETGVTKILSQARKSGNSLGSLSDRMELLFIPTLKRQDSEALNRRFVKTLLLILVYSQKVCYWLLGVSLNDRSEMTYCLVFNFEMSKAATGYKTFLIPNGKIEPTCL